MRAGMNAYVTKPFSEAELIGTITRFCKTPREEKLYSLEHLELIARGNTVFIRRILDLFSEQTPAIVNEMEAAAQNGDLNTVKALAHKIKPTLDQLAITAGTQLVREIESVSPEQFDPRLMRNKVLHLQGVIDRVCGQIRKGR